MGLLRMVLCTLALGSAAARSFDADWRFYRGDAPANASCDFSVDLGATQCFGLEHVIAATTTDQCRQACCLLSGCQTWQFCPDGAPCDGEAGCWIGQMGNNCRNATGWISRAKGSECESDFCSRKFDDSAWRQLDVPHDWSIEDLPPRDEDETAPVLAPRYGTWRFAKGDNPEWSKVSVNDSSWERVVGGEDWRVQSGYTDRNATGWYRQTVDASDLQLRAAGGALVLDLGVVAGVDQTWLNGRLIGSTGTWGTPDCGDYTTWRSYKIPTGALNKHGNVVAIRVFTIGGAGTFNDGTYPGGLYDDPRVKDKDVRSGAFDAAASLNGRSYGYTVGGVGWYRKWFELPNAVTNGPGSVVRIQFDGVYMNSDMYLNGVFLGNHPYGYTSFEYTLPPTALSSTGSNLLAVKVANLGKNSRWYSGSGIFRHTRLLVSPSLYLPQWGLGVTTPVITASSATVQLELNVHGVSQSRGGTVALVLTDPAGRRVASGSFETGKSAMAKTVNLTVDSPQLWSPHSPTLYSATATLQSDAQQPWHDPNFLSTSFGFRTISFDATSGFKLNGVVTKLYGGCLHHDNGPLGSKAIDRAEERRVQLLKANGYNAIRTSHNPVSPAFLDACDREGIMVMDEAFDCWEWGKNPDDYHLWFDNWWKRDIESMVLRDRNHPSVIMWSIGNEIPMRAVPAGFNLSHVLSDYVRSLDNTRAVTSAYPGVSDVADKFFAPLEAVSYTHLRAHETPEHLVCRLLLEKKKKNKTSTPIYE
eukprot:TRINITY_DN15226_c0_g1_i2.p1 TRINITY_DN15226_c0_g1~~TRINITY_DN15226_c0_g1_i2.p1  ORF type:complete len:757 (+),score=163.08 TRINITY_DN15226_c0_g1_i2:176-2446(+)